MSNSKRKILIKVVVFILIFLLLSSLISYVLTPPEGATRLAIHDLYIQKDIDVVYVGASSYYRAFDPAVVDSITNKKSINIGSPGQTSLGTYYILKEMFKTHSPQYVIVDISRKRIIGNDNAKYSQILLNNTAFSLNKIQWIAAAYDYQGYYNAIFPGFNEARAEYILSRAPKQNVLQKMDSGYRNYDYASVGIKSIYKGRGFLYTDNGYSIGETGRYKDSPKWNESKVSEEKLEWFRKTVELCRQHNAKVILVSTPVAYGNMDGEYQGLLDYINNFAKQLNVEFVDFNLVKASKYQRDDTHFYDERHMTMYGAEPFSKMFGEYLRDDIDGSLNEEDYVHSSFQELLDNSRFLFSTWFEYDETAQDIKGKYTSGTIENDVEYQYLYNTKKDKEFQIYRDYNDNPYAEIETLPPDAYQLRLQIREKGADEEYQQFYVKKISKVIK